MCFIVKAFFSSLVLTLGPANWNCSLLGEGRPGLEKKTHLLANTFVWQLFGTYLRMT